MRPTWEQIVDYARGIAGDEAKSLIESDAVSLEKAKLLSHVQALNESEAPENWVNRAKALLPKLETGRIWIGKLVYSNSAQGFRSAATQARDLRFEFEGAQVEIRIEPIANSPKLAVVGMFTSETLRTLTVVADGSASAKCDEIGQFELAIKPNVTTLRFQDSTLGDVFEIELI